MRSALQVLAAVVVVAALIGLTGGSITALPGFQDATGPTEMRVESLDRLESGCKDDLTGFARSSFGNHSVTKLTTIEADRPDAALSASVVRLSPPGADLSDFRIDVETTSDGPANGTCQHAVRYDLRLSYSGGQDGGLLPDDHGMRVRHYENGRFAGCSGSVTGGLDYNCARFHEPPERTWANATVTSE